jgi:imidazole glycerol-phosphate synthase subunit HisF
MKLWCKAGARPWGLDAVAWAKHAENLGAGEICLNSIDADGTRQGYELNLTRMVSDAVGIPVIASGGAGEVHHLAEVLREGHADAALIASMVHYGTHNMPGIKRELALAGVPVRPAENG